MNNLSAIHKGVLLALATAIISGTSIFYNKIVVTAGIDPIIFNIIKNGGVGLILTALMISTGRLHRLTRLTTRQWSKLLAVALIGGAIPFILFFTGLTMIPAATASLIHKSLFLWVAVMAIPLLGERINLAQTVGYLFVAWAAFFTGGFTGFSGSTGELMILAATLLWSLENVVAKIALRDVPATTVAWARMFLGSIYLLLFAASQGKLGLLLAVTPTQLATSAGSILFLTGYVLTWYAALSRAPATLVASILVVGAPVTNILTATLLTHTFPQGQILPTISTVLGVIVITYAHSHFRKHWSRG